MKRRNMIAMNDAEISEFLEQQRTLQVATIDHDGYPHLVAMWYALVNDELAFWTYGKSQKAINLRRDPRLACLVESGQRYEELRGVQIKGQAVLVEERAEVQRIGERIWERYAGGGNGTLNEQTRQMVAAQAAKRIVVIVKPVEVVSWDHRKLGSGY